MDDERHVYVNDGVTVGAVTLQKRLDCHPVYIWYVFLASRRVLVGNRQTFRVVDSNIEPP